MCPNEAIGIFDSGLGGLTVAHAVRAALPSEDIVYLGDTARVPYGSKSASTVIRYSTQIAKFLLQQRIKYLVVACNTASAHALPHLRNEFSLPVMGVVEPGASAAAAVASAYSHSSSTGKIGVIGTVGTVESGAYQRALQAINPALIVFGQPCPLFVPLAEEGWFDHPVTAQVARHYLGELITQSGDLNIIVLGCTHYPMLKKVIETEAQNVFGHPVTLIDSAEAAAAAVSADLLKRGLVADKNRRGTDKFYFTDVGRFAQVAGRFWGAEISLLEHADL